MRQRDTTERAIVAKRWHSVGVRSLPADPVAASVARHRLPVLACAAIVLQDVVPVVREGGDAAGTEFAHGTRGIVG
ncbi:MAG: hypothetical protein LC721_06600 [Actinobacteria bacterium]|nr:hypothetical protein [Actinomycetota bacterium]